MAATHCFKHRWTEIVLFTLILISFSTAEDVKGDISRKLKFIDSVTGRHFSDVYQNGTFRTGMGLWDNILNKCASKPSIGCLQKNFYSYLDESLDFNGDIHVNGVFFEKNNVDMNKFSKEANIIYLAGSKDKLGERSFDAENEIEDDEESGMSQMLLKP